MDFTPAGHRWASPPLALQIVALLVGGLVIAQLVTLVLTLLLPPEPPAQYDLGDIAATLQDDVRTATPGRTRLQRLLQTEPPQPVGPGWLTSERSRHELAVLLHRGDDVVQLWFYTPLPFAGTARAPREAAALRDDVARLRPVDYLLAQAGPPSGPRGGPSGPAGASPMSDRFGEPGGPNGSANPGDGARGNAFAFPPSPGSAGPRAARPGGASSSESQSSAADPRLQPRGDSSGPGLVTPRTPSASSPPAAMDRVAPAPSIVRSNPSRVGGAAGLRSPEDIDTNGGVLRTPDAPMETPLRLGAPRSATTASGTPRPAARDPVSSTTSAMTAPAPRDAAAARRVTPPTGAAISARTAAPTAPARGWFGLAPAPFVEGDFIAALQTGDGWIVVQPVSEGFPNAWQRRVLLWFAISFALIAPLGWLFARRLVRPISGFALAAERLGRDPTVPVLALEGPAEVGRAAHAFNRMQSRLRSFVDERTAMIGAISHDLRTPLTRLRFRIEDVEEPLREGMLHEVDEMEQMITSVLTFIRNASEPGSREKLDLSTIVEDVVEDSAFIGNDVKLTLNERAPVEVDAIGMRRLLANLVENAVKYGDHARVRLFTDRNDAVTEVSDDGPGLPDDELERVFEPFYRASAARSSDKQGSGLGLAVCRSIARAHGGDVHLMRGEKGLIAQLRVPLAFGAR